MQIPRLGHWIVWGGGLLLGGCGLSLTEPSIFLALDRDLSNLPPCVDDDCNCGDFRNQETAQRVLMEFEGDPFRLDRDENGVACDGLSIAPPLLSSIAPISENVHLTLGNPSNANTEDLNNYLIERSQYALSYNSDRGTANWVSWQLNADWLGNTERQDNFRQDGALPAGVYQVTPNDYVDSGFDRGHTVPSGDRTRDVRDNSATFLMTNIFPQVPENNRALWRELEEYSRDLVYQFDYTLFVIAGGYGTQAEIAAGRVTVPSRIWKIVVALEPGQSIDHIDANTPVIAVDMPNRDLGDIEWQTYLTTVDRIEIATGYDFLSKLPDDVEANLESFIDELPLE